MKTFLKLILSTLVLSACATTHPGRMGVSRNNNTNLPILVSAETIEGDSDEPFQLIDVTVENNSDRWVKINSAQILLNSSSNISIVTGNDLKDWAKAMNFKIQKEQYNNEMAQTGILLGGAAAMAMGGKGSGVATAGAIAVIGTSAWAVTDAIRFSLNKATQVGTFPDDHLSHPFSMPGKLFVRRWILINKPSKTMVKKLVLEFETISGEKDVYEVSL